MGERGEGGRGRGYEISDAIPPPPPPPTKLQLFPSGLCSAGNMLPSRPLFPSFRLSVSDSRLNRKSNYTPIILPCQILNSAGARRAPPPPNRCSYPGERGGPEQEDGMEEKERGREAREATARA